MKNICVFCGSSKGLDDKYTDHARMLATEMAAEGLDLVYGGANLGLMKVMADTILEKGGKVIGVIPHNLIEKEIAHAGLTAMHVVDSMSERKELMAELSDAFIALPGGIGTLDELFEVMSWNQLGMMQKPVSIFNIDGFFNDLISFLKRAEKEKFLREEHLLNLIVEGSPSRIIQRLRQYKHLEAEKWVDRLKEKGY